MKKGKKARTKQNRLIEKSVNAKLVGYSAAAVAALAYGVPLAQAVPVATILDTPVTIFGDGAFFDVNMDNAGEAEFRFNLATYSLKGTNTTYGPAFQHRFSRGI